MSGLILGFSVNIAHFAQLGYGDTVLMASCAGMFCSAAWMLCSPTASIVSAFAFGVALGFGVLTKGHIPVVLVDPTVTQIPADGKLCQGCVPADSRVSGITNFTFVQRNSAPYIQTWNLTTQAELKWGLVASR